MKLFTDGNKAFTRIIECINASTKSIKINMFIWRDDEIGNTLAKAVLAAAERGVKCELSLDRVGALFEYAEESKRSLFHPALSTWEKIETKVLSYKKGTAGKPANKENELARKIINHPNVKIDRDRHKNDHSKFYVFDDEILIFGGVNIEDKENGTDARGFPYRDYMIELDGAEFVKAFFDKWERRTDTMKDPIFLINQKTPTRFFEIEKKYVELIESCQRELIIVMAYFPMPESVLKPLIEATKRNVKITILISESANFQDAANKRSVKILLKKSQGKINVLFSPFMLHTKLMISDDAVCVGSCNLSRRSLYKLDELNILTSYKEIVDSIRADVEKNLSLSRKIDDFHEIRYNPLQCIIERILS